MSTTGMPLATGMPTITGPSEAFTTPSVTVPPNFNNPYIIKQHSPTGTVFIAMGSIVGFILLMFILYHLIKSVLASRMTKRSISKNFEKYNSNNSSFGLTQSTTNSSVAKLPLLVSQSSRTTLNAFMLPMGGGGGGSQAGGGGSTVGGDNSTIYQSEYQGATSKHDLTKMFISPTAEVMYHKRTKSSQYGNPLGGGSVSSIFGGSTTNLGNPPIATSRHSTFVPSLYINNDVNNSDYSLANTSIPPPSDNNSPQTRQQPGRSQRKTVPSMFLEDLIDEQ
ncbi:uncharacterized protein KQ657_004949 [Scheffersomyces spartinae]|uniref:Uncharacterized protein n=1 Tax=Scheffersomyces spartinae TaxID=45513 RepID=A0A9P7VA41_9ASCO|nr:uncharacterized protein KQ657_004949 [Scheffersomyces spartinae]KAG7194231.1 hypothetical protein KQ657_004949 [Scheffersomyces spartinae]